MFELFGQPSEHPLVLWLQLLPSLSSRVTSYGHSETIRVTMKLFLCLKYLDFFEAFITQSAMEETIGAWLSPLLAAVSDRSSGNRLNQAVLTRK